MLLMGSVPRWGLAILLAAAATGLNFIIQFLTGERVPFLPYFPAIMAVGVIAGAGPHLATLLAAAVAVSTLGWPLSDVQK